MSRWISVLLMALAVPCFSAEMSTNRATGEVRPWPPINTVVATQPDAVFAAEGWYRFDADQQAAWEAAKAAEAQAAQEQAEAEASNAMPDPQNLAPAISNGTVVGTASILVDAATMLVYATPDQMSPKHPKGEQLGKLQTKSSALMATKRAKNFNEFIVAWSNYVTIK